MIDKLTLAVLDMDGMVVFYAAVLGVAPRPVAQYGRTLHEGEVGGLTLLFCPRDLAGVVAETNTVQVRFVVDDVAAACQAGLDAGGALLDPPTVRDGRLHAALRDPDGNSLELRARIP